MKTGVLRISDWAGYVPHLEAIWTSTGRSCAILEPSWAEVGALLAEVDPKSGCGQLGSKGSTWAILDRSAKCANNHSPNPVIFFCGLLPSKMQPPRYTSLTDLSGRIHC